MGTMARWMTATPRGARRHGASHGVWRDMGAAASAALALIAAGAPAASDGLAHGNIQRTGYVDAPVAAPFRAAWVHVAPAKPRPAWKEPVWEPQRIDHDYAYAVAVRGDTVFYASSSDHGLHALDLATGGEKWVFFTGGPVRLAPDFHGGNVLFGSDDGWLYCVAARDGALVWRYRPEGIRDEWMIGNEQAISRWPCRTGALVEGDRVYAGFGILAPEGTAVACLDARTGAPVWVNDTCGYRYMNRPHLVAMGGVAPEGYLAVNAARLVVATGRSTPALFDKRTGRLLYHEADGDFTGGALNMATEEFVFGQADTLRKEFGNELRRGNDDPEMNVFPLATLVAFDPATGHEAFSLRGGSRGTLSPDGRLTLIGRGELMQVALDDVRRAAPAQAGMAEHTFGHFVDGAAIRRWSAPVDRVYTLLHAGDCLLAGGRGTAACFDAATGRKRWEAPVDGQARAQCAGSGAWIVSTTEGKIYGFRPHDGASPAPAPEVVDLRPAAAAGEGPRGGYALALGRQDAESLAELSGRFELVVTPAAPERADALRRELHRRHLQGSRVSVQPVAGPALPYTDYFADAVVARFESDADLDAVSMGEVYRRLRPCGGAAEIACGPARRDRAAQRLRDAGARADEIAATPDGLRVTRGALEGAGEWTHQYGDPGRRVSSDERLARLPLKAAWFGGLGPGPALTRHYRTPAPLVIDGRCFAIGTDRITAFGIYNGRLLWQREFPDLARWPAAYRGAGAAADRERVFVLTDVECLALDPATGATRETFSIPPEAWAGLAADRRKDHVWEYLAVAGDLVVGTVGQPNRKVEWYAKAYPVNRSLFALDRRTGAARWVYRAEEGIDSNAIAIDDGVVCLIDGRPRYPQLFGTADAAALKAPRALRGLDLATGHVRWETRDVAPAQNCLWMDGGVVVATQMPVGRDLQDPQIAKAGGGITAFSAADGRTLWRVESVKNLVPMIVGGVFYAPAAYDLKTGRPVPPPGAASGHYAPRLSLLCSTHAGCPTLIVARQSSMGFYDLAGDTGLYTYSVARPSCWINMIPAGGLVVAPEGGSSCSCAYNYKASFAFMADERHFSYALRGGGGADDSAVRVNFGAPGFHADRKGRVWAPYPEPVALGRSLGDQPYAERPMSTPLKIGRAGGAAPPEPFGRNPDWVRIEGTDEPWLYACGIEGAVRLTIGAPLGAARYKVTLHFCELETTPGPRAFDVKLQGQAVLEGFDIAAAAGGPRRAVSRDFIVSGRGSVELELAGRGGGRPPAIAGLSIEPAPE